jgi:hypothetical protein
VSRDIFNEGSYDLRVMIVGYLVTLNSLITSCDSDDTNPNLKRSRNRFVKTLKIGGVLDFLLNKITLLMSLSV